MTDVQETARTGGWVPLEEWTESGKAEELWVDAPEFVRRGPLMDRISEQTSTIRQLKRDVDLGKASLKQLADHQKKLTLMHKESALRDLKDARKEARGSGDDDRYDELTDQIREVEASSVDVDLPKDSGQPAPEDIVPQIEAWAGLTGNETYLSNAIVHNAVNLLADTRYKADGGGRPLAEYLTDAMAEVKTKQPHLFPESAPALHPGTPRGGGGGGPTKKFTAAHLNDEQKAIAKTFVDMGAFDNTQEYVDQLVETGELS